MVENGNHFLLAWKTLIIVKVAWYWNWNKHLYISLISRLYCSKVEQLITNLIWPFPKMEQTNLEIRVLREMRVWNKCQEVPTISADSMVRHPINLSIFLYVTKPTSFLFLFPIWILWFFSFFIYKLLDLKNIQNVFMLVQLLEFCNQIHVWITFFREITKIPQLLELLGQHIMS